MVASVCFHYGRCGSRSRHHTASLPLVAQKSCCKYLPRSLQFAISSNSGECHFTKELQRFWICNDTPPGRLEHQFLSRTMFRFSTSPDLRLLGKVCMTKGEDAHGPGSDQCSRANQILLGSYWGRSMHTISSGPTRDTTHSHPPINHWPPPSGPGFPAESPTASSRLLGCLSLVSVS